MFVLGASCRSSHLLDIFFSSIMLDFGEQLEPLTIDPVHPSRMHEFMYLCRRLTSLEGHDNFISIGLRLETS